jgi:aspartate racemase
MIEKIIGVLGGMGPESTADFFLKLINETPATTDQEHLRIIIDCNPKIPDRTAAILGEGESPLEQLKLAAFNLEKAGAEIIAIPCNTAHYYYDDLQKEIRLPIVHMLMETASHIRDAFPKIETIGLLATTGTIKTGIYHRALDGMHIITPDDAGQKKVMAAIYGKRGIKAGFTKNASRKHVVSEARRLVKQGVELVLMGCTEISLVLKPKDLSVPLIDPLQILAKAVVRKARRTH